MAPDQFPRAELRDGVLGYCSDVVDGIKGDGLLLVAVVDLIEQLILHLLSFQGLVV